MNDLIRRSDAVNALRKAFTNIPHLVRAKTAIEAVPAVDTVEVVRCRECKHNAQPPDRGFSQCELDAIIREPEFWCRSGDRREDGDNDADH